MTTRAEKQTEGARPVTTAIRADAGLSLPTFARMTGVPEEALARWQEGNEQLDPVALSRLERVCCILQGLARVMRVSFIATWLEQPNDACKEIGTRTPLALLERGDYAEVEDMIFYLESGVPG